MANKDGLDNLTRAFDRAKAAPRQQITKALLSSGEELAAMQRHLAPDDPATSAPDLKTSIAVTGPGQSTPPYSQPGGSRVAGEHEVIVTAGNTDVRYPHLVEYGTAHAEAQSRKMAGLRLLRKRLQNRIDRAGRKAVRDAWNDK
jgi:hypothetical protein